MMEPSTTTISKLKQYKNIILLKSADIESIIKRRSIIPNSNLGEIYINTHKSSNNEELSTQTIYVDGKSPEEIADEIISLTCHLQKK